jgi:hypothetical protein
MRPGGTTTDFSAMIPLGMLAVLCAGAAIVAAFSEIHPLVAWIVGVLGGNALTIEILKARRSISIFGRGGLLKLEYPAESGKAEEETEKYQHDPDNAWPIDVAAHDGRRPSERGVLNGAVGLMIFPRAAAGEQAAEADQPPIITSDTYRSGKCNRTGDADEFVPLIYL